MQKVLVPTKEFWLFISEVYSDVHSGDGHSFINIQRRFYADLQF